ncbi:MAG: efflux RND transporter periplasmic adaptor subunit [Prevotellaceae bacterium]|jgi:RND family efflux transporter MFP subunit|nr:efflux RND transporter periplasmic adaptor subunit [Prevotellaceae bacterium]
MKSQATILYIAALLGISSCGGWSAKDNHSPDEAAHEEQLLLTSYGLDFEVYAEVTPLAADRQSAVVAHFSYLKNFKPLTAGAATASLIVGGDSVSQTLDAPESPGVYRFSLQPSTVGTGRLVFDVATPEGASRVVVPNVRVYADRQAAEREAEDAADEIAAPDNSRAVFTKEQSWKVDFATEELSHIPFGEVIRVVGQVQPAQGDERVIAAKSGGMVSFCNGGMVEGQAVGAGQALFSIESEGLADNNLNVRYAEAEGEYNRAKAEYERKKKLAGDKIVSESELLKAQTELVSAEAMYRNLQRNFSSGKQVVSAPTGGFIKQVWVRNGEYVSAGQPVATVAQNRNLLIRAEVQPKRYGALNAIASASFRALNGSRAYSLEELDGRVAALGRFTDAGSPLIPVTFEVKNSAGFLPGSFVEVYIKTQTSSRAVAVANASLVEEMGSFFVYVQRTPELFEKRPVKKGATDGFRTEITSGLSAGERVVSMGAILVKLAQNTGGAEAAHAH